MHARRHNKWVKEAILRGAEEQIIGFGSIRLYYVGSKRALLHGKYQDSFRGNRYPRLLGYKMAKYDRPSKRGDFRNLPIEGNWVGNGRGD